MKHLDLKKITGALIAAALISTPVFAQTDFSQYTTDQLAKMRATVKTMPVQERKAFMKEWQKRLMAMTPQERQQYMKQMQQQMQNGPNGPNGPNAKQLQNGPKGPNAKQMQMQMQNGANAMQNQTTTMQRKERRIRIHNMNRTHSHTNHHRTIHHGGHMGRK